MNEKILCEKCGAEMSPIDPDKPVGMVCPHCGWGWATSYIEPIMADPAVYTVILRDGTPASEDAVKTVSRIAGVNFLQAKRMIENAPVTVFAGKGAAVRCALGELRAAAIRYRVDPPFPYEIGNEGGV